jgi:hypothetical protein
MTTDTIATRSATRSPGRPAAGPTAAGRRVRRAATVAGAAAAALAGWALAGPIAGVDLTVQTGAADQRVGPVAVVAASLLAGAAAWAVLALLERLVSRPRPVFTAVALAALALSLPGPLTSAADPAGAAVLAGLHVVVAAVLVPALPAATRRGGGARR